MTWKQILLIVLAAGVVISLVINAAALVPLVRRLLRRR